VNEHFLTEIEIKQFKCFTGFKAEGFKRVNLIGGKNNVGKTAFMEACYIVVQSERIDCSLTAIVNIKFMREQINLIGNKSGFRRLLDATKSFSAISNIREIEFEIFEKDATKEYKIKILGQEHNIKSSDLDVDLKVIKNITFICNYGWPDVDLITQFQAIQKADKEYELNRFIHEFDSSIESFKVIGDKPQCKTNGEYRELNEFGDGMKHYISIICALYACENGYLFIDEIDNGIHYTQWDRLWELILTLSKKTNCQVFATTHSKEMLESYARTGKKLHEQDISYITLVKDKEQKIKALTRDYDMLLDSIEQNREVRGW
jgi:AAA15 family ATPase/GTPase